MAEGGDGTISVKVKDQEGGEMTFKIKTTTKLGKVIAAYTAKKGLQANAIKLTFDGERIKEGDTPESLGIEDGDVLDAMLEQLGGGGTGRLFWALDA